MKKRRHYVSVLALVGLILSGCTQDNTAVSKPKKEVEVGTYTLKAERLTLQQELSGRTKSTLSAEIRPQVGGIIQARLFEEGTFVKKDTVLYQIDPSSYQAAYDEAKAALNNAEAAVEAARLKSERYGDLVKIEGVSKQDAEDANVAYAQALATVQEKRAALESAKINVDYTKIKAPISGQIGTSSVTPGALVSAAQTTALATIRTLDPMYVDMSQSSTQMLKLRILLSKQGIRKGSTKVALKLEDGTRYAQEGDLRFQEVAVDESTGSVTLRATFANPEGILLPGMYVRAIIDEAVNDNALLVPQQGVMRDAKGNATAYVVNENNTIETRALQIDRAIKDRWLVTNGLKAGDKVVVEGTDKVRTGDKVRITDVSQTLDATK